MGPKLTGGSKLTAEAAEPAGRPCLHVWASVPRVTTVETVRAFIADHGIAVLNVAGSRGSKEPEVAGFVRELLTKTAQVVHIGNADETDANAY